MLTLDCLNTMYWTLRHPASDLYQAPYYVRDHLYVRGDGYTDKNGNLIPTWTNVTVCKRCQDYRTMAWMRHLVEKIRNR